MRGGLLEAAQILSGDAKLKSSPPYGRVFRAPLGALLQQPRGLVKMAAPGSQVGLTQPDAIITFGCPFEHPADVHDWKGCVFEEEDVPEYASGIVSVCPAFNEQRQHFVASAFEPQEQFSACAQAFRQVLKFSEAT